MMQSPQQTVVSPAPFDRLREQLSVSLPNIEQARSQADATKTRLRQILNGIDLPETTALVVFGSLARREWTDGSDVDWTLLVNGPSDPEHFRLAILIGDRIRQHFNEPGPTQTFGTLTSSHELVHHVGGDEDTNRNMTRRVLLLLESCSVFGNSECNKVIRAVLQRYIVCGPGVPDPRDLKFAVPRFLLNDVVRLWRTFAVDYAAKKWQRADKGWALRNAKLRIPRKLTFAKGLLMCLDSELLPAEAPWTEVGAPAIGMLDGQLVNGCTELVNLTPLDMLSRVLLALGGAKTARKILRAYDDYLGLVNDQVKRKHLDESVEFKNALNDQVFSEVREISHRFGDGLQSLFFEEREDLTALTQKYGVF
jgi:predicted nucleotidyltransferase